MRTKAKEQANADLELEVQPVGLFSEKLYTTCGMEKLGPSFNESNGQKWVGLLCYPNKNKVVEKIKQSQILFPYKLLESPFIEYSQTPLKGATSLGVIINQLHSLEEAKKHPNEPF